MPILYGARSPGVCRRIILIAVADSAEDRRALSCVVQAAFRVLKLSSLRTVVSPLWGRAEF